MEVCLYVCLFVCLFVCMFVCLFASLFVCMFVCWIYPPNPTSFDTLNLSAEVPIEKLIPSHQRFFLYERKRTQLSYLSTIFFLSDLASNGIPNDMYHIIYL